MTTFRKVGSIKTQREIWLKMIMMLYENKLHIYVVAVMASKTKLLESLFKTLKYCSLKKMNFYSRIQIYNFK